MKFLAILKDSLRETIDSWVFYIMLGLSALLILFTFTLKFTPQEAAQEVMTNYAVPPLYVEDLGSLRPEEQLLLRMIRGRKEEPYSVLGVDPLEGGALNDPSSSFHVVLRARLPSAAEAGKVRTQPGPTLDLIRKRFGTLEGMQVFEASEVQLASADARYLPAKPEPEEVFFELRARPTEVTRRIWPHDVALFLGAWSMDLKGIPLGLELLFIEDTIVCGIGAWIAVLVSIVITAFFIPNMLRKGTADLLIVKPIHRSTLLVYKFLGGLIFIFLNTALAVVGVWLAISLRSGIWADRFLLMIFVITFFFALLYSISTLFGVLTRNAIAAILLTCVAWVVLFIVGIVYTAVEGSRLQAERNKSSSEQVEEGAYAKTVRIIHAVLPRTRDFGVLESQMLAEDLLTANQLRSTPRSQVRITWSECLVVDTLYIALMLGLSCLWFATRDY
jgi:ABC-type transport system involved in multi-copper enzyme maturation permease subunit